MNIKTIPAQLLQEENLDQLISHFTHLDNSENFKRSYFMYTLKFSEEEKGFQNYLEELNVFEKYSDNQFPHLLFEYSRKKQFFTSSRTSSVGLLFPQVYNLLSPAYSTFTNLKKN